MVRGIIKSVFALFAETISDRSYMAVSTCFRICQKGRRFVVKPVQVVFRSGPSGLLDAVAPHRGNGGIISKKIRGSKLLFSNTTHYSDHYKTPLKSLNNNYNTIL